MIKTQMSDPFANNWVQKEQKKREEQVRKQAALQLEADISDKVTIIIWDDEDLNKSGVSLSTPLPPDVPNALHRVSLGLRATACPGSTYCQTAFSRLPLRKTYSVLGR